MDVPNGLGLLGAMRGKQFIVFEASQKRAWGTCDNVSNPNQSSARYLCYVIFDEPRPSVRDHFKWYYKIKIPIISTCKCSCENSSEVLEGQLQAGR